jgi:hypothetical protein
MSKEPDDTVLREDHVRIFLSWYGARAKLNRFPGDEVMWMNAFRSLSLGELRNGMRAYERFESKPVLAPPQFWSLCKGTTNERAVRELNKAREKIRTGKIRVADKYKPRDMRDEHGKPGTSHD